MELVLVIIFGIVIWAATTSMRRSKKKESSPTVTVTLNSRPIYSKEESVLISGQVEKISDSEYCINPKSPLPIHFIDIDEDLAKKLKNLMEGDWWQLPPALTYLFAQHNLQCPELDAFVEPAKQKIRDSIAKKVQQSHEWAQAGEKDRIDLITQFQLQAISELDCKPVNERVWQILLLSTPGDFTADDALLEKFCGRTDLYQFYVSYLGRGNSAVQVPADDFRRKDWESLVELKLAKRGADIPVEAILDNLRMKDINEFFAGRLDKKFTRKAAAVQFAANLPDVKDVLSKHISLREMFLISEPEDIDVSKIRKLFEYANAQAQIIFETCTAGRRTLEKIHYESEYKTRDDVWQIEASGCCNQCSKVNGKRTKTVPAKLPPFHIGCGCSIEMTPV